MIHRATYFLDEGNTRIKLRCGSAGGPLWVAESLSQLEQLTSDSIPEKAALYAATVRPNSQLETHPYIKRFSETFRCVVEDGLDGLRLTYSRPQELGVDRWLAMLAVQGEGVSDFLILDAGSAITLDLVSGGGVHQGGFILPGFTMQRDSLADKSARLKSLLAGYSGVARDRLGNDSGSAMLNGSLYSLVASIQRLATAHQIASRNVVITGGDAGLVHAAMPDARIVPELVLDGLQRYAELKAEVEDK